MFYSSPSHASSRNTRLSSVPKARRFVVQFSTSHVSENEIDADSVGHALSLQKLWIDEGASYVEIFRVLHDGTLNPTIGGYYVEEAA